MSLNDSSSPFIASHKDNLIKWREWGPEALAEARAQGKPILLSIGYIGCSWCHTLSRESFSDTEVASLVADNFIPILVDRDQRRRNPGEELHGSERRLPKYRSDQHG